MYAQSVVLFTCVFAFASAALKYKPVLEKCEIGMANADYIKDMKLDCHRHPDGHFTITSNGDLLKQINLDDLKATAQVYQLENNEYSKIDKAHISIGLCTEYKMQTLGNWQDIEKHGNLRGCGVLEPGNYHMTDYQPKIKMIDVKVPEGRYKLSAKLHHADFDLMELVFYIEIKNA